MGRERERGRGNVEAGYRGGDLTEVVLSPVLGSHCRDSAPGVHVPRALCLLWLRQTRGVAVTTGAVLLHSSEAVSTWCMVCVSPKCACMRWTRSVLNQTILLAFLRLNQTICVAL